MRVTAISVAVALMALSVSTSLQAQRVDAQVDPRSLALLAEARDAKNGGKLEDANDLLESALAVDPRNRAAFLELADIARSSELPGKAIRLYREALVLEPNDLVALRGQGEAMVAKGAVEKAKANLERIKLICKDSCDEAGKLAAVIAKGPPEQKVAAKDTPEAATAAAKPDDDAPTPVKP